MGNKPTTVQESVQWKLVHSGVDGYAVYKYEKSSLTFTIHTVNGVVINPNSPYAYVVAGKRTTYSYRVKPVAFLAKLSFDPTTSSHPSVLVESEEWSMKFWCKENGDLHRENNEPACESRVKGLTTFTWAVNGVIGRDDGEANVLKVLDDGGEIREWRKGRAKEVIPDCTDPLVFTHNVFQDYVLHREKDGVPLPAVVSSDGREEYYIDGVNITSTQVQINTLKAKLAELERRESLELRASA